MSEEFHFDYGDGQTVSSILNSLADQGVQVTFFKPRMANALLRVAMRFELDSVNTVEVVASHKRMFGTDGDAKLIEHIGQVAARLENRIQQYHTEQFGDGN